MHKVGNWAIVTDTIPVLVDGRLAFTPGESGDIALIHQHRKPPRWLDHKYQIWINGYPEKEDFKCMWCGDSIPTEIYDILLLN